jgi:hypothetical protein
VVWGTQSEEKSGTSPDREVTARTGLIPHMTLRPASGAPRETAAFAVASASSLPLPDVKAEQAEAGAADGEHLAAVTADQ